jgi:hypothetical protein
MAFRKKIRVSYKPCFCAHGFSERKFVDDSHNGSSKLQVMNDVTVDELSKSVLPLISNAAILSSGNYITGDVSFSPSDRADVDADVTSALAHALDSYQTSENVENV